MRILGIDPGYAQTGWGVVESDGQHNRPVSFGVIKTSATQQDSDRIHFIAKSVGELAVQHQVAICGMEDIFFTKNVSSAIPVAKVIGACVHQLALLEIPVRLYSPPTRFRKWSASCWALKKFQNRIMLRMPWLQPYASQSMILPR